MAAGRADDQETHVVDFRGPFVLQRLAGGWTAVYRLAPQGADVVIAELRLIPTARQDTDQPEVVPPGGLPSRLLRDARPDTALRLFKERLAETLTPGTVAREARGFLLFRSQAVGQLTEALFPEAASMTLAELMQSDPDGLMASVTPERARAAQEWMAEWVALVEDRATQRWGSWSQAFARSRSTPTGRVDRRRRLVETAALYVDAVARGDAAPNERVAKHQGRKVSAVRDDLYAARRAGLLTAAQKHGRPGGQLTTEAKAILAQVHAG